MRYRLLAGADGLRQFVVVLETGDGVPAAILRFAEQQGVGGASLTAIGGFQHATLGWFDNQKKKYRKIEVDEQCEVIALVGDIAQGDAGDPVLHAHTVVGLRNGRTRGGHLLGALVRSTLEVMITETPATLRRRLDPDVGAALIDLGDTAQSTAIPQSNTAENDMAKVRDPVCGMMVDPEQAAGTSTWNGETYYFCSGDCKRRFDNDPARYAGATEPVVSVSREPPFTRSGPMVSPKFGSATSGGGENEPGPGD